MDPCLEHLEAVLNALGIDPRFVAAEIVATTDARWAKTANRSVVGVMNEFSFPGRGLTVLVASQLPA